MAHKLFEGPFDLLVFINYLFIIRAGALENVSVYVGMVCRLESNKLLKNYNLAFILSFQNLKKILLQIGHSAT